MISICTCASCKKELSWSVEGFDGKSLWITLDIKRIYRFCKESPK
jgi:hypothetical protein